MALRASKLQEDSIQLAFEAQARVIAQAFKKGLEEPLGELCTLGTLFSTANDIGRDDFHAFGEGALASRRGLAALSWSPRVRDADRPDFERAIEEDGSTPVPIQEQDERGTLVAAARRPEYVPVRYMEGTGDGRLALGLDLAVDPLLGRALTIARDSDEPAAVPIARLALDGPPSALLFLLPVFERGRPHDTRHERETHLRGYLGGDVDLWTEAPGCP